MYPRHRLGRRPHDAGRGWPGAALFCFATLAFSPPVLADEAPAEVVDPRRPTEVVDPRRPTEVVDPRRTEARSLGEAGDQAFATGRCDQALPLWRKADALYHAPTLVLRMARCEALRGHVSQAARLLQSILDEPLSPSAPPAFTAAYEQARAELPGVVARVAKLTVRLRYRGTSQPPVRLAVDGEPFAADAPRAIDPGLHRLVAEVPPESARDGHDDPSADRSRAHKEVQVSLDEGSTVEVFLTVDSTFERPSTSTQHRIGLFVGAMGAASLVAGTTFGVVSLSQSSDLSDVCGPGRRTCPESRRSEIDSLRINAAASELLLGAGVVGLGVSTLLLLTAPRSKGGPRVLISDAGLIVTPSGLTVAGCF